MLVPNDNNRVENRNSKDSFNKTTETSHNVHERERTPDSGDDNAPSLDDRKNQASGSRAAVSNSKDKRSRRVKHTEDGIGRRRATKNIELEKESARKTEKAHSAAKIALSTIIALLAVIAILVLTISPVSPLNNSNDDVSQDDLNQSDSNYINEEHPSFNETYESEGYDGAANVNASDDPVENTGASEASIGESFVVNGVQYNVSTPSKVHGSDIEQGTDSFLVTIDGSSTYSAPGTVDLWSCLTFYGPDNKMIMDMNIARTGADDASTLDDDVYLGDDNPYTSSPAEQEYASISPRTFELPYRGDGVYKAVFRSMGGESDYVNLNIKLGD